MHSDPEIKLGTSQVRRGREEKVSDVLRWDRGEEEG
jgi:hypothetical protein